MALCSIYTQVRIPHYDARDSIQDKHYEVISACAVSCNSERASLYCAQERAARLYGPLAKVFDNLAAAAAHGQDVPRQDLTALGSSLDNALEGPQHIIHILAPATLHTFQRHVISYYLTMKLFAHVIVM